MLSSAGSLASVGQGDPGHVGPERAVGTLRELNGVRGDDTPASGVGGY